MLVARVLVEPEGSAAEASTGRCPRICPTCGTLEDKPYELAAEQKTLSEPCPNCGFNFPVAQETPNSTAVFKDLI